MEPVLALAAEEEADRQAALAFDLQRLEPEFLENPYPACQALWGEASAGPVPVAFLDLRRASD